MTKDEFDAAFLRLTVAISHAQSRAAEHTRSLRRLIETNWRDHFGLADDDIVVVKPYIGKSFRAKIVGAELGKYRAEIVPVIRPFLKSGKLGAPRQMRSYDNWEKEA